MALAAIHDASMTRITLTGVLGKKFGTTHVRQLDTGQGWEAFRSLKSTLDGFEQEVKKLDRLGMRFAIFRNGRNVGVKDFDLAGTRELKIVPVVEGSKRAGVLQTVVGVVLIVAAAVITAASGGTSTPFTSALAAAGYAMAIGGVLQMLSPQLAGLKQSASPENLPSYAFGSAKNTTASGNPVPICIGERRWGGAIVSASIYAEDKS